MPVLSVDLAYKDYADVGVVEMASVEGRVRARPIRLTGLGLSGRPTVPDLARKLVELAKEAQARWIVVDGPQGWKAPDNGLEHARRCEAECSTPGKTGLPGFTKPANYLAFISFSIELFDALSAAGWPRVPRAELPSTDAKYAIESFPTSAWRCLGIASLPGKSATTSSVLADRLRALRAGCPVDVCDDLTHDELQALAAGLAGIAFDSGNAEGVFVAGLPPVVIEGTWREGYIINPSPKAAA